MLSVMSQQVGTRYVDASVCITSQSFMQPILVCRVVVRIRPRSVADHAACYLRLSASQTLLIDGQEFAFDDVFADSSTQQEVRHAHTVAEPLSTARLECCESHCRCLTACRAWCSMQWRGAMPPFWRTVRSHGAALVASVRAGCHLHVDSCLQQGATAHEPIDVDA